MDLPPAGATFSAPKSSNPPFAANATAAAALEGFTPAGADLLLNPKLPRFTAAFLNPWPAFLATRGLNPGIAGPPPASAFPEFFLFDREIR